MADKDNSKSSVMDDLLAKAGDYTLPVPGTLVQGTVVAIFKNKILVDLDGIATGIISGQEAHDSAGTVEELNVGDEVYAYVLDEENEDGLVVLSLKRASQKKTWGKFLEAYEADESIKVKPSEANKGGLLINIDGIKGFIPVSQLAPMHYPRVDGADSSEILKRLQKLIGVELSVRIINMDREGGKLILSERAAEQDKREEQMEDLEIGQKVKGKISGVVKFGLFVTFNGLEGLVHISEIAWGHVKNPSDYGKIGDEVEVLVIGKERDKISLSMKRLTPDPWVEATKKYQVGSKVKGEVTRVTPFGAFVKLDEEINGLIHVSEITDGENVDPADHLKVGETVEARIVGIEPEEHRVALSLKEESTKADKKGTTAKKEQKADSDKIDDETTEEEAA